MWLNERTVDGPNSVYWLSSWNFGFYWNVFKIMEDMLVANTLSVTITFQDNIEPQIQCNAYLYSLEMYQI